MAKPGTDFDAFFDHWLSVHAANVRGVMEQVGGFRYLISHSLAPAEDPWAGLAELYFHDPSGWDAYRKTIRPDGMERWVADDGVLVLRGTYRDGGDTLTRRWHHRDGHVFRFKAEVDEHFRHAEEQAHAQGDFGDFRLAVVRLQGLLDIVAGGQDLHSLFGMGCSPSGAFREALESVAEHYRDGESLVAGSPSFPKQLDYGRCVITRIEPNSVRSDSDAHKTLHGA